MNELQGKNFLVTGGASGLGLGCVKQLLERGAQVCIADVNARQADEVCVALKRQFPGAAVSYVRVDLSARESVNDAVSIIEQRFTELHGLINNAGIYPPVQRRLASTGRELCFEIAFTGHFALTLQLLPLLNKTPRAKIVTVSSLVQQHASIYFDDMAFDKSYTPIAAYAQAKLSNLLFARELQRRLSALGSSTTSYAAHPGVCRTSLGFHRPRHANDNPFQRFRSWFLGNGLSVFGQSPENGARPLIAPFLDASIPPASFLGPRWVFQSFGEPKVVKPGKSACDAEVASRLWSLGEEFTGLHLHA